MGSQLVSKGRKYEEINIYQPIYLIRSRKECQYGDFDFAGYIPRIGRGNEIH